MDLERIKQERQKQLELERQQKMKAEYKKKMRENSLREAVIELRKELLSIPYLAEELQIRPSDEGRYYILKKKDSTDYKGSALLYVGFSPVDNSKTSSINKEKFKWTIDGAWAGRRNGHWETRSYKEYWVKDETETEAMIRTFAEGGGNDWVDLAKKAIETYLITGKPLEVD